MTTAALTQKLTEKLGNETAENLMTYMEESTIPKIKLPDLVTKGDLAEVKADLIKWMFIFWIGQLAATITICLLIFKR